jgi:uncharacterized membrane protein
MASKRCSMKNYIVSTDLRYYWHNFIRSSAMAIKYAKDKTTSTAKLKIAVAGTTGIIVALATGVLASWQLAPLLGWDAAALVYIIWLWAQVWPMDGGLTAKHAVREDPSRTAADSIVLAASVASLATVGVVLAGAADLQGGAKLLQVSLGITSVVLAWLVVHTLFALRYAELYYRDQPGGVDFPKTPDPSYQDFAYLAFTVGMTFQVSDTGFQTTAFRRTALRHSLISYLFGTVIVATTINLIAGLTTN